ncbi:TonB-dependent receptor [Pseudoxanthomonas sp. Root630]|uniref:TonB-dependent receptor plug domain-containing protein n=1 Tax=Pseudoxanthomonas sp. Root630 TaxID=1736574 RepID=UPI000B1EBF74|nr:TonB-dependent receptor [Pseudoxanthomonas sp. Root630]
MRHPLHVSRRHRQPMRLAALPVLLAACLSAQAAEEADRALTEFDAVVVTATASERSVERAPASVTVITGEELRARPARDVLDAIRDAPGLNIRPVGSLGRRVVSIRGMESRHTLVLVDGERIAATDQVFGLSDLQFGWVPLEAIERVEIVRGPLSSLYGSDALGGVINIITRAAGKQWGGGARMSAGAPTEDDGGEQRQASVHLSGPLGDRLSLTVDGAWQKQQALPEPDEARLDQREGQEQATLRARLQWKPADDHRLALTVMKSDEDRWYNTSNTARTLYYQQSYDFDRTQIGISYDGEIGGGHLRLAGQIANIHQRQRNTQGVAPSPEQEAGDTTLNGHYGIALGRSHRLTAGFEGREERLEHPSFVSGEATVKQYAGFLQDEWALTEQFDLVYGARLDKHDLFGSEVSPRIYAVWQPAERWTVKGGYSRGFKAPMLKQISPDYRFDGPHSFIGNPDVQPEKSDNLELSVGYSTDAFWWRATAYRNTVEDLIDSVCIEFCSRPLRRLYRYENVDDVRIRGAELEAGVDLPANFRLSGNYAYNDVRDESDDARLPERPLQTGNARLAWASADNGWQLELRYDYTGRQLTAGSTPQRQPSYGLWNTSVKRRFGERVDLQVGVENLTDHRVEEDGIFNYRERGRYAYAMLGVRF